MMESEAGVRIGMDSESLRELLERELAIESGHGSEATLGDHRQCSWWVQHMASWQAVLARPLNTVI